MAAPNFLPYARQSIDEADIAAVVDVLRGDWLTTGPKVGEFESALAARLGCRHAVSCSSGTAALHLAYLAADLGPGDAVIVPSITFLATASAAVMAGATPVFADVDPHSGLMTEASATDAIQRALANGLRIGAIVPVHLAGQCAEVEALARLAADHGAVVIEDACHALGTQIMRPDGGSDAAGSCAHSRMTVFSFHAVKTLAAGEGGAVTTNDPALKARLERLRNHGIMRPPSPAAEPWLYAMEELGWNYRFSDIQAALARSQLRRLDKTIEIRRALVARYDARLLALGSLARPIKRLPGQKPAWHLYPVSIDFDAIGIDRGQLMNSLREAGIGTQVHYIPVHTQPYYAARYPTPQLTGADLYYRHSLSLPLFVGMSLDDVDRVTEILHAALIRHTSRLAS